MREIGTIVEERQARALADYLLTLNITTKVEPNREGFAVWVHREDRLPEARAALVDFRANPDDPRFETARQAAKSLRKEAEKVEAEHRKRSRNLRDRWEGAMYTRAPLAFGLIAASVAAFLAMNVSPRTYFTLAFSLEYRNAEGFEAETGFPLILAGQYWRLVTPIFLHFGIFHLVLNMAAMRVFGEQVEMRKGPWRLALLVVVAAIVGNVTQFLHSGGGFGGMSGVVFALAGYLWVKGQVQPESGLALGNRSFQNMLIWFAAGFLLPAFFPGGQGFPFNVANVVHAGGLAVGILFGLVRF